MLNAKDLKDEGTEAGKQHLKLKTEAGSSIWNTIMKETDPDEHFPVMWFGYTFLFVFLPVIFSLLCSVFSVSIFYGFVLFFPLAAFNAFCYFCTFWILQKVESFTREKLPPLTESKKKESGDEPPRSARPRNRMVRPRRLR